MKSAWVLISICAAVYWFVAATGRVEPDSIARKLAFFALGLFMVAQAIRTAVE